MFTRLITLISLFSILIFLPARLADAAPPATAPSNKPATCPTCQQTRQPDPADRLDRLSTLGRRTQVSPLLPLRTSMFDGFQANMVSTSRGYLAFGVTDLYLPGLMPIVFQRSYVSNRSEDIGLGGGWSYAFSDRIKLDGDAAIFTDLQGSVTLRREGQNRRFVPQVEQSGIHQQFELTGPATIIERVAHLTREYTKIGDAYYLTRITGPGGVNMLIDHDAAGNVLHVENDPGGALNFEWTDGQNPSLVAVVDNAGRRVSLSQQGRRLRTVVDATGSEWTYDYTNGLLRQAKDPVGRVFLRARYDKSGHVTAAGDAAGWTRYEYEFGPGNVSRRTVVTDPLAAVTVYEQTAAGALTVIKDDEGRSLRVEYNTANRPVRLVDSVGDSVTLSYDSQNRLLSQSTNGTVDRAFSYDADGRPASIVNGDERAELTLDARDNITAVQSSDPARSYSASYDARGALTRLASKNRDVSFEYDGRGNETAITYSDSGRFSYERDAVGRVSATHFPSGLSFFNEYDARGAFTRQSDNRGNAMTVQLDASGAPIAYVRADGKQMRAVRDETGRVIRDTDFDGNVRTFAYDTRGSLTDYTARGKHKRFEYDHRGRLSAIVSDDGVRKTVERDERGHIRRLNYSPTAKLSPSGLQMGPFRSLADKRWAHAPLFQDPPPDCCDDPIITDVWAPYWPGGSPGLGGVHPPLLDGTTDGGTGGGVQPYDPLTCATSLAECAAAVIAYPGLIIALDAACGVTFGIGCLLALLALPTGGLLAALLCASAIRNCHLA